MSRCDYVEQDGRQCSNQVDAQGAGQCLQHSGWDDDEEPATDFADFSSIGKGHLPICAEHKRQDDMLMGRPSGGMSDGLSNAIVMLKSASGHVLMAQAKSIDPALETLHRNIIATLEYAESIAAKKGKKS